MKFTQMTLGALIGALEALPAGASVRGFDPDIHSYRGYYERNAVTASDELQAARAIARTLKEQIGKRIYGWKGGDYNVSVHEGIYLADHGDTGPIFAGLTETEPGVYEPVLVDSGGIW